MGQTMVSDWTEFLDRVEVEVFNENARRKLRTHLQIFKIGEEDFSKAFTMPNILFFSYILSTDGNLLHPPLPRGVYTRAKGRLPVPLCRW